MQNPMADLLLPEKHRKKLIFFLRALVPSAKVLVFGSRVNGTAQELSDIDLALVNSKNPEEPVEGLDRLKSALQESDIPYLVDLYDWSELPAHFKERILENCVELTR